MGYDLYFNYRQVLTKYSLTNNYKVVGAFCGHKNLSNILNKSG